MAKTRLLIGSSICQKPKILEKFFESLQQLDLTDIETEFYFVDDNQIPESKEILKNVELGSRMTIVEAPPREELYLTSEEKHFWNDSLVLRVANIKNGIMNYAIEQGYDYLFLIDSDLLINQQLIQHLLSYEKDIVSEIFWTFWELESAPLPNIWMYDIYEMTHPALPAEVRVQETVNLFNLLKQPGLYEVGGMGACTLISVSALKKGLNFDPIKNISFWGEDRWFCIRAIAMGLQLFVDTHYPAKHLYRESDLENLD